MQRESQPSIENVIAVHPASNTETDSSIVSPLIHEASRRLPNTENDNDIKEENPIYKERSGFYKLWFMSRKQDNTNLDQNRTRESSQCLPLFKLIKRKEHPLELAKRKRKTIWCFREMITTTAFAESRREYLPWTPFHRKNQSLLTKQLELFERDIRNDSCKLQDRGIRGGTLVVTVWLQETMAFALDPELSEPITFEIACLPKLSWYQKMVIRYQHRKIFRMQNNK